MAASASATVPTGQAAMVSPVEGLKTGVVASPLAGVQAPAM